MEQQIEGQDEESANFEKEGKKTEDISQDYDDEIVPEK